jgi:hypothetical protein
VGIQLPGELADLLNEFGYTWPKADEERLFELGQLWVGFGGTAQQISELADAAAEQAWTGNTGAAIEAFQQKWSGDKAAAAVLHDGATGAEVVGAALFVCAGIVLALKINVIVQLTILAIEIIQAIATAAPTFGASLLEIPAFKKLTDLAINFIISKALEAILG